MRRRRFGAAPVHGLRDEDGRTRYSRRRGSTRPGGTSKKAVGLLAERHADSCCTRHQVLE